MPCYPGYRYCGPGCSGPGTPVNRLDAICIEHDACYRRYGQKVCDDIFLRQTSRLANQPNKIGRDARFMNRVIGNKRNRY
ncbi:Parvovirus coat protein VP1-like protein [Paraliobacillus zengyii]|uniref:Parvovirus coat protein VP1-like protein n=1 Tax=Paraliobacillus zengyii TaxID=2213194 RepID=UPI000DD3F48C